MSDTSAPEIRPATDEEIATIVEMGWSCDCSTKGPNHPWMCVMVFGPRLIERIEADRAAAQERDRKIAELVQERDDDTALIRRLNATVTAQAEALKSLEWCMPSYSEGGIDRGRGCPSCGGHEYGTGYAQHEPGGHRDKCRLAAALKPESKE